MSDKRCSDCKASGVAFSRNRSNKDGLCGVCKVCERKRKQQRNARNRVKNSGYTPEGYPQGQRNLAEQALKRLDAEREAAQRGEARLRELELEWSPPEPTTDEHVLPPLESAYVHHQKAKESRNLRREHGSLVEENTKLRAELAAVLDAQRAPSILVYSKPSWERSDAVALAVASDWHIEEPVIKNTVHGLNEYNLDIARERARFFFQNLLRLTDIMARETKVTTITLQVLGDLFSGWIHEELLANTLLAPADAALFCKELLISGIDYLLRESSYVIEGDMIPGNHGRLTKTMHFGNPTGTSLETVAYHGVADRYRDNPRVRLNVSNQSMVYRRIFEKFILRSIHGYETKYLGGIGGLTIPLRKALAQWNNPIRADLTLLGHYHQLFDGGDFLVNGSLIGYNLYAQQIKAAFEEARQAFLLVHARKGGQKSITAPIWLDDAHHAPTELEGVSL
jgi:hypothetical protein